MAIQSQLPPQLALAIRQGALRLLALQAGQMVEAKVLGTTPNGATQVQIGKQSLNLTLPVPVTVGTLLTLLAQGSGSQQKLVLMPLPNAGSNSTHVETQTVMSRPTIPLPASSGTLASAPARPVVPMPLPGTVLPIRAAALQPLALQAGQRVEARVSGVAANGATQMQIGRQTLEIRLPIPLPVGTMLPLQAQTRGVQPVLVVLPMPVQVRAPAAPGAGIAPQALPADGRPAASLPAAPSGAQSPSPSASPAPTVKAVLPGPALSASPSPSKSPPQAALAQMVQGAVQRQDSIATLTTMLAAMAGKGALPQPVTQAIQNVLAASFPLGPAISSVALQKAILASGVFQEAMLAQGAPELAKGDLKTKLLTLQKTLVSWLGTPTKTALVPPGPLPPPVRGALPRASPLSAAPIELPDDPVQMGKALLERTDSSLARLRLHQHASLPDQAAPTSKADWSMDIPVLIGNYQSVMQLQIHRDEANPGEAVAERGWQIRFALDLPKLGEMGAQVGLRGRTTSVRLWASNADTASVFERAVPELVQSLVAAGLRPGNVIVRAEEKMTPRPSVGHFVDSRT